MCEINGKSSWENPKESKVNPISDIENALNFFRDQKSPSFSEIYENNKEKYTKNQERVDGDV